MMKFCVPFAALYECDLVTCTIVGYEQRLISRVITGREQNVTTGRIFGRKLELVCRTLVV